MARIALLKPASSNASCQSSTPALKKGLHFAGVLGSMKKTIGSTGSETDAPGFRFSRRYRWM